MKRNQIQTNGILRSGFIYGLLVFTVALGGKNTDDIYEFPVRGGTSQWESFQSHGDMLQACMVPEEILRNLSTDGLIQTCLSYPLLMDIVAFDNLQSGFNRMVRGFNGLQELLQREDAGIKLLNLYRTMRPDALCPDWSLVQKGNYAFQFMIVEMLLAQEQIARTLSAMDRETLVCLCLDKIEMRKKYTEVYGLFNQIPSNLLIGRILQGLQFDMLINGLSDEGFSYFLTHANTPPDDFYMQLIQQMALAFLQPESDKEDKVFFSQCQGPDSRDSTVFTPNGSEVTVTVHFKEPCTKSDLESFVKYNDEHYPHAIILSSATGKYNCHSYAWHNEDTTNNCWMVNPSAYVEDGSYEETTENNHHYRVVYYKETIITIPPWFTDTIIELEHSATLVPNAGKPATSKWGKAPRYAHDLTYCPYDTTDMRFYEYPAPTPIRELIRRALVDNTQSMQGILTVSIQDISKPTLVAVYTLAGRKVYERSFVHMNRAIVDLRNYGTGIYAVRQIDSKGVKLYRVAVK